MAKLFFTGSRETIKEYKHLLTSAVNAVLNFEQVKFRVKMAVFICGDDDIADLNKRFRDKDAPTDVLSFPSGEDLDKNLKREIYLGDVAINIERAMVQAKDYAHSLSRELAYLMVHAALHLLGYDHENAQEEIIMREKATQITEKLGLGKEKFEKIT